MQTNNTEYVTYAEVLKRLGENAPCSSAFYKAVNEGKITKAPADESGGTSTGSVSWSSVQKWDEGRAKRKRVKKEQTTKAEGNQDLPMADAIETVPPTTESSGSPDSTGIPATAPMESSQKEAAADVQPPDTGSPDGTTTQKKIDAPVQQVKVHAVTNDSLAATENKTETRPVYYLNPNDHQDFKRLHNTVINAVKASFEAGGALKEIHDRELWRADNFENWNAYCETVQGMTRRYANLLISISEAVETMRQVGNKFPTSPGLGPQNVTQVTPLLRIKDNNVRCQVWETAVERSGGRQPAAKVVKQVVAEILATEGNLPPTAPASPKLAQAQRLSNLIASLEDAHKTRDWALVERLIGEFKKCTNREIQ